MYGKMVFFSFELLAVIWDFVLHSHERRSNRNKIWEFFRQNIVLLVKEGCGTACSDVQILLRRFWQNCNSGFSEHFAISRSYCEVFRLTFFGDFVSIISLVRVESTDCSKEKLY